MVTMAINSGTAPLPFPVLAIPPYHADRMEQWTIRKQTVEVGVRGYFRGMQIMPEQNWVLRKGKSIWMSVTPMELESLAVGVHFAHGEVLVLGLGMGVVVYNLLRKASVERITVIEHDPAIIDLMVPQIAMWGRTQIVDIQQGDALTWSSASHFDTALADIWPMVGDSRIRADTQAMARHINAGEWHSWGIELDYVTWCSDTGVKIGDANNQRNWRAYSKAIGVPLVGRSASWMARLALQAGVQFALATEAEHY